MSYISRTVKLCFLVGIILALKSPAILAAFITVAPGGASGLSPETVYCAPAALPCPAAGPPLAAGPGPVPLLLPPPPGNPVAAPGAYIVDAISSGRDAGTQYLFSVDPVSVGAAASPVAFEVLIGTPPSQVFPGPAGGAVPPEADGDIFATFGPLFGVPALTVAVAGVALDEFALGLNIGDDINGLTHRMPAAGMLASSFYSLGFGGLGLGPFAPGDIVDGGLGLVYAAAAALGLDKFGAGTDDIDALIVHDLGPSGACPACMFGVYDVGVDFVAFSLDPGSVTLGMVGLSPGDLLFPGGPAAGAFPAVFIPVAGFGLLPGDNLNAIDVGVVPIPAAAWLFGSALGLLVWMKRRQLN